MATNHGLGFGNGGLTDRGGGIVEYRATGKILPAFKVDVANITGFGVRKATKQDRKNGASSFQQVFVVFGAGTELASTPVNYGTAQKLEAWFRAHPMFRGNVTQVMTAPSTSNALADELLKLAHLRDAGVLSPTEFEQAKAKLLA